MLPKKQGKLIGFTISFMNLLTAIIFYCSTKLFVGCLRPEDVSDDEKLSRTIKIIAVSKFIKEIVKP